jgi:hypothetical protein
VSKGDPVCAQQRRLLERPSRRAFGAPQDEEVARFRQPAARSSNQRSPFCVGSLLIPPGRRFPNPPQSNQSPAQQNPNPAPRKQIRRNKIQMSFASAKRAFSKGCDDFLGKNDLSRRLLAKELHGRVIKPAHISSEASAIVIANGL